jgi:hypothetical protein
MGVKGCFRNCCTNIMCDRYSSNYGYICDECFEELINSVLSFTSFMSTPKNNQIKGTRRLMAEKEFNTGVKQ